MTLITITLSSFPNLKKIHSWNSTVLGLKILMNDINYIFTEHHIECLEQTCNGNKNRILDKSLKVYFCSKYTLLID